MIESFAFIENIGRYERVRATPDFGGLTLVYSENGRGKTTLSAILRSLTMNDPIPIQERKRLSANSDPRVVMSVGGAQVTFVNNAWNTGIANPIVVFDERFVNENVYSGLSVESGHRKNLHQLVLGAQGVQIHRQVVLLTEQIANLQTVVREKGRALTPEFRGNLSIDDFCALPRVNGLDAAIQEARATVAVLEAAPAIAAAAEFEEVTLPGIDVDDTTAILGSSLADVHAETVVAVQQHFEGLGTDSEEWVSKGMTFAAERTTCPFCDQDLIASRAFTHYEAYFSQAYKEHIEAIAGHRHEVARSLSGDALADFRVRLERLSRRCDFWRNHIEIDEVIPEGETIENSWKQLRERVDEQLQNKVANPLEAVALEEEVIELFREFQTHANGMEQLCERLQTKNDEVRRVKEQAQHGNLATAQAELQRLLATQRRFDPAIATLCDEYRQAVTDKEAAETQKDAAKTALDNHRNATFPQRQTDINRLLLRFNADFTLESFRAVDPRGQPSSTFELGINRNTVPLAADTPTPSFGNTLSAGDRNTLALAFFFAALESDPNLANAIVVIDDPASSLDDGRSVATAQQIRGLCGLAHQVIVLSHTRGLLCEIWAHADERNTECIQIVDTGPDSSTIEPWDVSAAAITEYDRKHEVLRNFADNNQGDVREVAMSLRPVLEAYLRTACVEHCPPGRLLGPFVNHARQLETNGMPLMPTQQLDELDLLKQYANRFHHDNTPAWQQNLANLNQTELQGFARRVLHFTKAIERVT